MLSTGLFSFVFTLLATTMGPPSPDAAVCPLTGLPGDPALASRNPLAVMVENTRASRPQSGLDQAEVVFEVHVEGGVTRYMGVFGCTDAGAVGPVRSTRQVFASWARSIDAFLGHAWAKPSGYEELRKLKVRNIDGVRLRGVKTPYFRIDSRQNPHNLYTSTAELRRYAREKEYEPRAMETPLFPFKDGAPAATPTHPWIGLDFNGTTYFSHFVYDAATNRYARWLWGKPHEVGSAPNPKPRDKVLSGALHTEESASQIAVDNVLVLFMRERVVAARGVLGIGTVGEGRCVLFRDGIAVEGRWVRARESDRYAFLDAAGAPIPFNRGRTWIGVLPEDEKLTFTVPPRYRKRIEGPVE